MRLFVKIEGLNDVLARLSEKQVRRAAELTMSRVARSIKTEASKAIRETYTIKKQDLDPRLSVRQGVGDLKVILDATHGRDTIPLAYFSPKRAGRGVTVEIKRGQRKLLTKGILATMPSGHTGVFMRMGKAIRTPSDAGAKVWFTKKGTKRVLRPGRKFWSELPIQTARGPSAGGMIKHATILPRLEKAFRDTFRKRFVYEYSRLAARKGNR